MSLEQNRSDIPIIILSIMAVLVAGVLSTATITSKSNETVPLVSTDPDAMADVAARAGLEEAVWHIETHGRTRHGSLSSRYCINGALYFVEWGDVNLADSTVIIRSRGEVDLGNDQLYHVSLETVSRIGYLPPNTNSILDDYYSRNREPIILDAR